VGNFSFHQTKIPGVVVVEPVVHRDHRGFFMETYHQQEFSAGGIAATFVQDNHSMSVKGVLRGLHFQRRHPQGKLVRVISGAVFDVAVDLRPNSPTLGKWHGEVLSEENRRQLYVPEGFAHGYLVLSDKAEFLYKCTNFYDPQDQQGILWDDPDIAVVWPLEPGIEVVLSDKDKMYPRFRDWLNQQGEAEPWA
jgi:dTDP-4-dehydrorhamnose 3,5-epimerase